MQKIEVRKEFEFAESNERDEERESSKPKSIKETRMKEKSERRGGEVEMVVEETNQSFLWRIFL